MVVVCLWSPNHDTTPTRNLIAGRRESVRDDSLVLTCRTSRKGREGLEMTGQGRGEGNKVQGCQRCETSKRRIHGMELSIDGQHTTVYTGREHGRIATFPKGTNNNLCGGAMHEHELIIMSSKQQACARVTRGKFARSILSL